jgi:hypothetical protein
MGCQLAVESCASPTKGGLITHLVHAAAALRLMIVHMVYTYRVVYIRKFYIYKEKGNERSSRQRVQGFVCCLCQNQSM